MLAVVFTFGGNPLSRADSMSEDSGKWQTHVYPKIGLKIQLPQWKAEIDDQDKMWLLLAYPLVENPAADVQYRVKVSVYRLTAEQHRRLYPTGDSSGWMNSQHLQTSEMTNAMWIYARQDVFGSNGFAYCCSGRVKRIPVLKSGVQPVGGPEEKLATDLHQILDSIEVLSTNSISRLLPKPAQPAKDLGQLFNAMTAPEIEHVKNGFGRLQRRMTPEECFNALGIDFKRDYPASSWGPIEHQSVSLMLNQEHVLILVWDAKLEPPSLISAQLDDLKWPDNQAVQKP